MHWLHSLVKITGGAHDGQMPLSHMATFTDREAFDE